MLPHLDHTAYKELYPTFPPLPCSEFVLIVTQGIVKLMSDTGSQLLHACKEDVIGIKADAIFPDLSLDSLESDGFTTTRLRIPNCCELNVNVEISPILYNGVFSRQIKVTTCGALGVFVKDSTSVLFQSADAILIQNVDCRILKINHAFERMYGWKQQELVGKIPPMVPHDREIENAAILKIIKKGIDLPGYETVRLHRDGRVLHVSITTSPLFNSAQQVIAIVSIMRDVTEHKRLEQELSKSVMELKRVQHRLQEREKLSIIGTMTAGMAHEIRNPLTAIQGFVKLIGDESIDNPVVSRYVQVALSEAKRANQILIDFLQLARPRTIVLQTVSLWACVHDVAVSLGPQALSKNVQIHVEPPFDDRSWITSLDGNQMKQVLMNLGQNAIEACSPGAEVTFRLDENVEKGEIVLEVRDTGSGIAPNNLIHLGVPFFSTKQGGTGLGLSISYAIIEAHKGRVEVDSILDAGTAFRIYLPDHNRSGSRRQS